MAHFGRAQTARPAAHTGNQPPNPRTPEYGYVRKTRLQAPPTNRMEPPRHRPRHPTKPRGPLPKPPTSPPPPEPQNMETFGSNVYRLRHQAGWTDHVTAYDASKALKKPIKPHQWANVESRTPGPQGPSLRTLRLFQE